MLCENCTKVRLGVRNLCRLRPPLQGFQLSGQAEGTIQADGTYFHARPEDATAPPTSAVVLLTDIFGLNLNNPKVMADEMSKAVGVDVHVPVRSVFARLMRHSADMHGKDLFNGKPLVQPNDL